MGTALRVGVFYGAPIAAIAVAVMYFAVLLLRVHNGAMPARQAARRFLLVLLLPIAVVLVVWGAGELASYLASPEQFQIDAAASTDFLMSLLPLAAYVGAPIVGLVIAFWSIASARHKAANAPRGDSH